ncbi:hypothetical protein Fcan01_09033 [Folsomia candida]|uniref:F-box domain-containing protein n=1 Tax=Folsomia candida TaxID=158441 RepID=A0A226EH08_FOLCA|nr:hypothetical protein Fcan01_09033 [Folsomia candida]
MATINSLENISPSSSCATALENHLILSGIFQYLDLTSLKAVRLVCKSWEIEAIKKFRNFDIIIRLEPPFETEKWEDLHRLLNQRDDFHPILFLSFQSPAWVYYSLISEFEAYEFEDENFQKIWATLNDGGPQAFHRTFPSLSTLGVFTSFEKPEIWGYIFPRANSSGERLEFRQIKVLNISLKVDDKQEDNHCLSQPELSRILAVFPSLHTLRHIRKRTSDGVLFVCRHVRSNVVWSTAAKTWRGRGGQEFVNENKKPLTRFFEPRLRANSSGERLEFRQIKVLNISLKVDDNQEDNHCLSQPQLSGILGIFPSLHTLRHIRKRTSDGVLFVCRHVRRSNVVWSTAAKTWRGRGGQDFLSENKKPLTRFFKPRLKYLLLKSHESHGFVWF